MVFADRQGKVILPEFPDTVRIIFPVFIDIQVDPGGLRVDVLGDFTGRVKSLGISQVIHELCKGSRHLIRVLRGEVLVLQPTILIFLYKKGFPQYLNFACKILFLKQE